MTKLSIRKANLDDFDALLPLINEFVESFELDSQRCHSSFRRLVDEPSASVLVAERGDSIVGYSLGFIHDTFYANGAVAWLEEIMVDSKHRRCGVAAALMAAFEAWAHSEGAVLSALATRRAAQFYEAIGYEESAAYYRRLL